MLALYNYYAQCFGSITVEARTGVSVVDAPNLTFLTQYKMKLHSVVCYYQSNKAFLLESLLL